MADEEHPEVHRLWLVDQIQKHVVAAINGRQGDRELVGEMADALARSITERQPREILEDVLVVPQRAHEVAALVGLRAQPDTRTVVEHGVQQHQAFRVPAWRGPLAIPVVPLPDRRVQRLVVHVEHPAAMDGADVDRRRESLSDELPDEVVRLLSMRDAGKGAVLALDEHARVDHHRHEKARLALGKAKRGHRYEMEARRVELLMMCDLKCLMNRTHIYRPGFI